LPVIISSSSTISCEESEVPGQNVCHAGERIFLEGERNRSQRLMSVARTRDAIRRL
jgi:hypothetical protein